MNNLNTSNEKYYHLYLHPTSTEVLFYFIPDEFNDKLRSINDFKIGFYNVDFNDYLKRVYDNQRHGLLQGKTYIQYIGKEKLNIEPKKHNIIEYNNMYYYEYDYIDIPDNLKLFFI